MPHANLALPILENGDRLDCTEFERRYTAAPHVKKAELIEGIVYVASPLRFTPHARPHGQLITWLGTYQANCLGTEMGIEPTVRLDRDNEPQPDAVLLKVGGMASIDRDGYISGAPELVAEISASTASFDLHAKKRAYERNGVREYIAWRTFDRQVDWFIWKDGQYEVLPADVDGIVRSRVFAGLWLNVAALLEGDMRSVLKTLQEGIAAQNR